MADRKYFTELGVNALITRVAVLQQGNLGLLKSTGFFDDEHPCHLYMLARRPRISVDPSTVRFDDRRWIGQYRVQRGDKSEPRDFVIPHQWGTRNLMFWCSYPYTEYLVTDESGDMMGKGTFAIALSQFAKEYHNALDLEVLYVGQAFGEGGSRMAFDRLNTHETLQRIYAEVIKDAPDMEVWLVLASFEPPIGILSMDGRTKHVGTTDEEDKAHVQKLLRDGISEQQRVNFTEAALIRYFQPHYNIKFKDTFPDAAHATYSECYDLDLNSVMVEFQTEGMDCRVWSRARPPKWTHFILYALHNRDERVALFDLRAEDGSLIQVDPTFT